MEHYKNSSQSLSFLKIFGILSIIFGLCGTYLAIDSCFFQRLVVKGSNLASQFIYSGSIAIIGGIAVVKKKAFGRWLFFFIGFFGILRLLINVPLNIYHQASVSSLYPYFYEYVWFWAFVILSLIFYVFLIIFFSLPNVVRRFN